MTIKSKTAGLVLFLSLVIVSLFYACGGGDDTVTITASPKSGETINFDDTIVISFSKSMNPDTLAISGTMAAASDGGTWSKDKNTDDTLTISPTTTWDSDTSTLIIDVKDKDGHAIEQLELTYTITSIITLTNFQPATVVVGQVNFAGIDANQGATVAANTIDSPYGNPTFDPSSGKLYLPDYNNNRILGYSKIPATNSASANFVIGQTDLTSNATGATAAELSGPQTAQVYNGKFFVADYSNNRALIYNTVPTTTGASANVVLGQAAFGTNTTGCTASEMNSPETLFAGGGKLVVTDSSNERVLIWNSIPTTNGTPPNVVLGQNSFTTCASNDDDQDGMDDGAPSARTFSHPAGVWTDGKKLVIVDESNNRVLIWNTFPTTNFKPADVVLGQSNFVHITQNDADQDDVDDTVGSAKALNYPTGILQVGKQLIVADEGNNRYLIYNAK